MRQQGDLLKLLSAAYVLAPANAREHIRRAIELCKDEEGPPLTPAGGVSLAGLREALRERREQLREARERSER